MYHTRNTQTQTARRATAPGGKEAGMTQTEKVKRHLEIYGSISSREAYEEYGIMRLGARIYDLRRYEGVNIEKTMKTATNRFGEKVTFAVYKVAS